MAPARHDLRASASRSSVISSACAAASPGVSRITGHSAARATSISSSVGISPVGQRGVPVAAGAVRVPAVVQVDQVDPPGDRPDVVDDGRQVPAGGPRVAGVEHEAGAELAHRVPEPGDRLQLPRHRVAAAGRVLDEQRQGETAVLRLVRERLAPVVDPHGRVVLGQDVTAVHDHPAGADRRGRLRVLGQQLPARNADPVVGGGHVEHVRRVDDHHDVALQQLVGVRAWFRALVALRVGQEDLHAVGVHLGGPGERPAVVELVVVGQSGAHVYADRVSYHGV